MEKQWVYRVGNQIFSIEGLTHACLRERYNSKDKYELFLEFTKSSGFSFATDRRCIQIPIELDEGLAILDRIEFTLGIKKHSPQPKPTTEAKS